jgi:hypothetical protein
MALTESTCWTVVRAAAGSPTDRDELARRIDPPRYTETE